jgi:hypothetical protein
VLAAVVSEGTGGKLEVPVYGTVMLCVQFVTTTQGPVELAERHPAQVHLL